MMNLAESVEAFEIAADHFEQGHNLGDVAGLPEIMVEQRRVSVRTEPESLWR